MSDAPYTGKFEYDLPQLAHSTLLALFDHGIVTTQQLVGKFLSMRHAEDSVHEHCQRFHAWLQIVQNKEDRDLLLNFTGSCACCIFPGSYDPSQCV